MVAFTFAWLLQVTAMPLAAVDTTEQVAAASAGQETGFAEQEGLEWNRPVKLKTVLIVVGALFVLAIIYSVCFRGIGHEAAPGEWMSAPNTNLHRSTAI